MYQTTKQFSFSASHVLSGLPEGHQCGRLHGHNYLVEVELEALELNGVGFIRDYGDLKPFQRLIDEQFDHRHLNDVLPGQPSAENMAKYFYLWCKQRWP